MHDRLILGIAVGIGCGVAAFYATRWLVNDFRIRTELRWEAEMEARGFELAPDCGATPTYDQLCADIAEEESRYLQTEWWLLNRDGAS